MADWVLDDEELLALAESAVTEIKVAQGLSEQHASVLAALRIRLRSRASASPRWTTDSQGAEAQARLAFLIRTPITREASGSTRATRR